MGQIGKEQQGCGSAEKLFITFTFSNFYYLLFLSQYKEYKEEAIIGQIGK